jgi:hypothetical protein
MAQGTWQRVSCHPLFAALLLALTFGGGWVVKSAAALFSVIAGG